MRILPVLSLLIMCTSLPIFAATNYSVGGSGSKGTFINIDGRNFCSHSKTNLGYSYVLTDRYIAGLIIRNLETGEATTYKDQGFVLSGKYEDSRLFEKLETLTENDMPRYVLLGKYRKYAKNNGTYFSHDYEDESAEETTMTDKGFYLEISWQADNTNITCIKH
ncbi:MAG: hypothetical protein A2504_16560 [Bdellovibrionales bacterium RIFOXYD12_FULL_39_22]|nr:MAG: hypothetical protein A2385_12840 [Bdellovibrionales bacterium RIFOXYB1_FULL_39_21]OFZ44988.1 MAG: hypothetical protein A2404_14125 [Bdellovibrionales bacterium RIFOXYC1_FULL_39_130]OFZ74330.1 MAG: hypothetical protein A2560_17340 [Bdellovibrionales bacterium RIFOXYD1_FULL_39_84]OFZ94077.1 MAG: hypothetical protein A2504_16560 [Bdellovibrionales bacterium RIFOXYD12_FULL_39_22]